MLHILRLSIPKVYLISGARDILVDAGGPKDVPRIISFLQTHGIGPGKLQLILLTHGHWDHAGGAAQLKAALRAPVAIHRADAELARRGINGPLKATNLMGRLLRPFLDRSYPPVEPDLLIEDEIDLTAFGVAARILFTPGHTPGSLSVRTADAEIIVGDLLMGGWFGGWLFPTRPGLHYYVDDLAQVHASVQKVLAASPRIIHPAHGGPLDPQAVTAFAEYL
jgi:glyoxylase-like metal-dependent hydrolase (beta-lactamase superfamily II)